jgi:predicted ATPase
MSAPRILRVYVDNYRCLVNFEFKPRDMNLVVGESGSGKTTLIDVVARVQDFVILGHSALGCFHSSTMTAWVSRGLQRIEVDVDATGGPYEYALEIEHRPDAPRPVVRHERLAAAGGVLYDRDASEVRLYGDQAGPEPEARFPFVRGVSFLSFIEEGPGNLRIQEFKRALSALRVLRLNPLHVSSTTREDARWLGLYGENLASWYRTLHEERPDISQAINDDLRVLLPGLRFLRFEPSGPETKEMRAAFESQGGQSYEVALDDLSDGQRALIVLYSLLHEAARGEAILFLDEPDNFVPLAELQPWLARLRAAVEERGAQVVVISHHPEVVDYLAQPTAFRFVRLDAGPVRVEPLSVDLDRGVKASEWLALRLGE